MCSIFFCLKLKFEFTKYYVICFNIKASAQFAEAFIYTLLFCIYYLQSLIIGLTNNLIILAAENDIRNTANIIKGDV